jgi:hypothetical protein
MNKLVSTLALAAALGAPLAAPAQTSAAVSLPTTKFVIADIGYESYLDMIIEQGSNEARPPHMKCDAPKAMTAAHVPAPAPSPAPSLPERKAAQKDDGAHVIAALPVAIPTEAGLNACR